MTEKDVITAALRAMEEKMRAAHQRAEQSDREALAFRRERDDIALEYAETTGAKAKRIGEILDTSRQSADHMLSRARRRKSGR